MTSCSECLELLSTMRLADLNRGGAVTQHCASCERCAQIVSDLRFAEQRLVLTLAELAPTSPSYAVATEAIRGAARLRRRTAARWFRAALGAFGLFLLGTYLKEKVWDTRGPDPITRTISPKCMKPEAAVSIVSPFLRSDGSAAYASIGFPALTIRGREREVTLAISQLDAFESKFCGLPDAGGAPATTATPLGETPRKD